MKIGQFELNKIYHGNALEVLKKMPSESVDMVMTSPPYWALRNYGEETATIWDGDPNCEHEWKVERTPRPNQGGGKTKIQSGNIGSFAVDNNDRATYSSFCSKCGAWKGQLGLEPTFDLYIKHLCDIFDEVKRVLKKTGTLWVNIGDTYGGSGGNHNLSDREAYKKYNEKLSFPKERPVTKLMPKSLVGIPFRFAIEMLNREWILRNTIIWHKCLDENTKFFVRRGNRFLHIPIKDVNVGDVVFTLDMKGKIRSVRIKDKQYIGTYDALRIKTKSGREIISTKNHKFPVKSCYDYGSYLKIHFKKADELTEKDHLWVNYYLPDVLPEGSSMDYEDGFVVGFFIAEGSYIKNKVGLYKDNNFSRYARKRWGEVKSPYIKKVGLQLSCGKEDIKRGYLDYFKKWNVKIRTYDNKVVVQSRDRDLFNLITKYVEGDGCDKKHLTQSAWNKNKLFLKGVIDGFLAGDGGFDSKSNRWRVGIKPNKELRDDLELACRIVGYEFRYEGTRDNSYGTKTMSFSIRKQIKRGRFNVLYVDQIDSIEEIGKREVYDIELEPIYTTYCGKGKTDKPTKENRKAKWNNLYFLANGIWTHNSNCMPSSAKDRFTVDFEYIFFFSKSKKYYFEQQFEELKTGQWDKMPPIGGVKQTKGNFNKTYSGNTPPSNPLGRNKRCVWTINTKPFPEAHFAVYPPELCETPIKAGCPEFVCNNCGKPREKIYESPDMSKRPLRGINSKTFEDKYLGFKNRSAGQKYQEWRNNNPDIFKGYTDCGCNAGFHAGVVLDPFAGAGTTCLVAKQLGRNYIGIEINPKYVKLANERINNPNFEKESIKKKQMEKIAEKVKSLDKFGIKEVRE